MSEHNLCHLWPNIKIFQTLSCPGGQASISSHFHVCQPAQARSFAAKPWHRICGRSGGVCGRTRHFLVALAGFRGVGLSHATRPATRALSRVLPRRRVSSHPLHYRIAAAAGTAHALAPAMLAYRREDGGGSSHEPVSSSRSRLQARPPSAPRPRPNPTTLKDDKSLFGYEDARVSPSGSQHGPRVDQAIILLPAQEPERHRGLSRCRSLR